MTGCANARLYTERLEYRYLMPKFILRSVYTAAVKYLGILVLRAAILLASVAVYPNSQLQAQEKPIVLVSVLPQAYFVDRIAGGLCTTQVMVTAGDVHSGYEPTIKQMKSAATALIYITVGHPDFVFETKWLTRIHEINPSLLVVNGFEGLELTPDDPHPWVSPRAIRIMINNITGALSKTFPRNQEDFRANSEKILSEVDTLDREIAEQLSKSASKAFLVFHPTWGYFARDYGLTQIAIEHEGKEPSVTSLADVISEARMKKVKTILIQPQFSKQSAETVAEELGATAVEIDPLVYDWFASTRKLVKALVP